MLNMTCRHCGRTLMIPEQYAGQTGKCKHCGGEVSVPAEPGEAARDGTYDSIMDFMRKKQYDAALMALYNAPDDLRARPDFEYLRAECLIQVGSFERASAVLDEIDGAFSDSRVNDARERIARTVAQQEAAPEAMDAACINCAAPMSARPSQEVSAEKSRAVCPVCGTKNEADLTVLGCSRCVMPYFVWSGLLGQSVACPHCGAKHTLPNKEQFEALGAETRDGIKWRVRSQSGDQVRRYQEVESLWADMQSGAIQPDDTCMWNGFTPPQNLKELCDKTPEVRKAYYPPRPYSHFAGNVLGVAGVVVGIVVTVFVVAYLDVSWARDLWGDMTFESLIPDGDDSAFVKGAKQLAVFPVYFLIFGAITAIAFVPLFLVGLLGKRAPDSPPTLVLRVILMPICGLVILGGGLGAVLAGIVTAIELVLPIVIGLLFCAVGYWLVRPIALLTGLEKKRRFKWKA
ncbi:MAG: tetratricopeptide repeat protein [Candidatus Hydrogenedentes bacterium]|nr:tetratricopeptide repeat protein [Candidatus Hydrogenedentota bacterium]